MRGATVTEGMRVDFGDAGALPLWLMIAGLAATAVSLLL